MEHGGYSKGGLIEGGRGLSQGLTVSNQLLSELLSTQKYIVISYYHYPIMDLIIAFGSPIPNHRIEATVWELFRLLHSIVLPSHWNWLRCVLCEWVCYQGNLADGRDERRMSTHKEKYRGNRNMNFEFWCSRNQ